MESQLPRSQGHHYEEEPYNTAGLQTVAEGHEGEQQHHEKKSVLGKVKAKAKKIKNTLTKHGHGHDHTRDEEDYDEDDEMVQDPEVHGAPIYDSASVTGPTPPAGVNSRIPKGYLDTPDLMKEDRYESIITEPPVRSFGQWQEENSDHTKGNLGSSAAAEATCVPEDKHVSFSSGVHLPIVADPIGNVRGRGEDFSNPIGNVGGQSGDFTHPIGNVGGQRENFTDPIGNVSGREGNFTDPIGNEKFIGSNVRGREEKNCDPIGNVGVRRENFTDPIGNVRGQQGNLGHLGAGIRGSIGMEKDPHALRKGQFTTSNYQTKVADPTGTGEEVGLTPILHSLNKMNIYDEPQQKPEQNVYTGSHDQFFPEPTPTNTPTNPCEVPVPKSFDSTRPENSPLDHLTKNPSKPLDRLTRNPSNQGSYTQMISSAASSVASKAASAKNVFASTLGYSGTEAEKHNGMQEGYPDSAKRPNEMQGREEDTKPVGGAATEYAHKIASTVTEKLAPMYGKVAGAGSTVMSKVQGGSEDKNASDKMQGGGGPDKGVSVKAYWVEKFRPGDEDKALSEVLSAEGHEGEQPQEKKSVLGRVKARAKRIRDSLTKQGHSNDQDHPQDEEDNDEDDKEMVHDPEVPGAPINDSASVTAPVPPTGVNSGFPAPAPPKGVNSGLPKGYVDTPKVMKEDHSESIISEPTAVEPTHVPEDKHVPFSSGVHVPKVVDPIGNVGGREGNFTDPIANVGGQGGNLTDTIGNAKGENLGDGISGSMGMEEDPHSPKKDRFEAFTPSNDQTKVSDPTGTGEEEEITPILHSLDKMNISNEPQQNTKPEQKQNFSTASHDQFSSESTPTNTPSAVEATYVPEDKHVPFSSGVHVPKVVDPTGGTGENFADPIGNLGQGGDFSDPIGNVGGREGNFTDPTGNENFTGPIGNVGGQEENFTDPIGSVGGQGEHLTDTIGNAKGGGENLGNSGDGIRGSMDMEEDPHSPRKDVGGREEKFTDPIGNVGEREENLNTASHDQFSTEPTPTNTPTNPHEFSSTRPENSPLDHLTESPSKSLDPSTENPSNQSSYAQMFSSAAASAKNAVASSLGYGGTVPERHNEMLEGHLDSANRPNDMQGREEATKPVGGGAADNAQKIGSTVTEKLAPVAGAGSTVMSKVRGNDEDKHASDNKSAFDNIEGEGGPDKGVSEKLRRGDEDEELPEVISGVLNNKGKEAESERAGESKSGVGEVVSDAVHKHTPEDDGEERKPMGKVTESKAVAERLGTGSGEEGVGAGGEVAGGGAGAGAGAGAGKGMVGMIKGTVSSWLGKGSESQTSQGTKYGTLVNLVAE
ncbi:hypothetical protein LguiB_029104 [Lonicera macranthoides]